MVESTVDVADWSSGALSIEVSKRFIYIVEGAKWHSKVFELYSIICSIPLVENILFSTGSEYFSCG